MMLLVAVSREDVINYRMVMEIVPWLAVQKSAAHEMYYYNTLTVHADPAQEYHDIGVYIQILLKPSSSCVLVDCNYNTRNTILKENCS